MDSGFTIWVTGLTGAGKSALASLLVVRLRERGIHHVEVFDTVAGPSDASNGPGSGGEGCDTNVARIVHACKLLTHNGSVAISTAVSPHRETREKARAEIGAFVEVYVRCPADVLVSNSYEESLNPDVVIDTDRQSAEASAHSVIAVLEAKRYLLPLAVSSPVATNPMLDQAAEDVYSAEEERLVTERLQDLGYL